jgi:hypothetical protein
VIGAGLLAVWFYAPVAEAIFPVLLQLFTSGSPLGRHVELAGWAAHGLGLLIAFILANLGLSLASGLLIRAPLTLIGTTLAPLWMVTQRSFAWLFDRFSR